MVRKAEQLVKQSSLLQEVKTTLRCSEELPLRLDVAPKIHKEETPLHPIVSTIGSPTYALAKHLPELLQPHAGLSDTYVRVSTHFVETLKSVEVRHDNVLLSSDDVPCLLCLSLKLSLIHILNIVIY